MTSTCVVTERGERRGRILWKAGSKSIADTSLPGLFLALLPWTSPRPFLPKRECLVQKVQTGIVHLGEIARDRLDATQKTTNFATTFEISLTNYLFPLNKQTDS